MYENFMAIMAIKEQEWVMSVVVFGQAEMLKFLHEYFSKNADFCIIFLIIIIIIKACWLYLFLQIPLAFCSYHSSLLEIQCQMNVSFSWLANTGVSICRRQLEDVTYEFILTSPAVSNMSNLDGSWDGR